MTDITEHSRGILPGLVGGGLPLSRTSFADQAYDYLFHKITSGAFRENEALPSENELCELFGISRPVVRQALERLRADGLIESRRGSGSFVKPRTEEAGQAFSEGKLRELLLNLEFRNAVEPAAAYFAAERRSEDELAAIRNAVEDFDKLAVQGGKVGQHLDFAFHHAVATATGNPRFVEAIWGVEYDIDHAVNLVRYLVNFDQLERAHKVLREHTRILKAIEKQDPEEARTAMQEHLGQALARMKQMQPQPT